MCLIAFAIGVDAERPLLLAANRDEYFERPTEPLHRWTLADGTGVFAGRDFALTTAQAGGNSAPSA